MPCRIDAWVDYYEVLNIDASATISDIRSAYRRAALLTHPDKNGGSAESFRRVALAFETLSDETFRATYDRRRQRLLRSRCRAPRERCAAAQPSKNDQGDSGVVAANTGDPERPSATGVGQNRPSPDASVGCKRPAGDAAADGLSIALEHLRGLLQEAMPEQRKATLQTLPARVRSSFLHFMQVHREASSQGCSSIVVCLESSSSESCQDSDSRSSIDEDEEYKQGTSAAAACFPIDTCNVSSTGSVDGVRDAQNGDTDTKEPEETGESTKFDRVHRGVVRVSYGDSTSYYADLMFSHMRFSTRCQPRLEIALEHHILLAQVRNAALSEQRRLPYNQLPSEGDSIREAWTEILSENKTSVEELGLRVSVRLEFGGTGSQRKKRLIQSPRLMLEEALEWRRLLLTSRSSGWAALRTAWIELLQHPGYKHKRPLNADEAERFVDSCAQEVQPQLQKQLERQSRRAQLRFKKSPEERRAVRLRKAVVKVERALILVDAAQRRVATAAERERRKLHEERHRWFRRMPAGKMTMEDLMQGLPSHLQQ